MLPNYKLYTELGWRKKVLRTVGGVGNSGDGYHKGVDFTDVRGKIYRGLHNHSLSNICSLKFRVWHCLVWYIVREAKRCTVLTWSVRRFVCLNVTRWPIAKYKQSLPVQKPNYACVRTFNFTSVSRCRSFNYKLTKIESQ